MRDSKSLGAVIPPCLMQMNQWVCWKSIERDGKPTKMPVNPHTGQPASSTEPGDWATFDDACAVFNATESIAGVGFVFTETDEFCGVDLDDCMDETGTLKPWAQAIVESLNSYTEVSPSGTGVKIFLKARKPGKRCRKAYHDGEVELYDAGRYFTVTGLRLNGVSQAVESRQDALDALYEEIFGKEQACTENVADTLTSQSPVTTTPVLNDGQIIALASQAGSKFPDLFGGYWQGLYPSQSEADSALCWILAFYTQDSMQIDRIFRLSGLMRAKWDELRGSTTYGHETIAKALAGVPIHYNPQNLLSIQQPETPRKSLLTRVDQIVLRPPQWLIRGVLEQNSMAMIFGESGCGKSFMAIDWACRVVTGTPWRSHAIQPAPVIYIAGEGQQGFARRVRAWEIHNGVSLKEKPFFQAPAIELPEPAIVAQLIADTNREAGRPALVVIDTLARNFGSGDENSTQDMGQFVLACDSIRRQYDCTMLVIHHTGHGDKHRARGAVALKAALDTEYRLDMDKETRQMTLTATKMKEAQEPPPLTMALQQVELPELLDDYGEITTSAAIDVLDADVGAIVSKAHKANRMGKWQKIGRTVAERLISASENGHITTTLWQKECERMGMKKSTRYDVLAKLEASEFIVIDGDSIRLTSIPESDSKPNSNFQPL